MFNSFNSLVEYTRDGETEISEDETEKAVGFLPCVLFGWSVCVNHLDF